MPYSDPLTDVELAEALAALPEWTLEGSTIRRSVRVADFRAAVRLVNAVADAAEVGLA